MRISTLTVALCLALLPSSGLAQTIETPQARAAYAKVVAQRNEFERSHSRFVAVNGIRMHYLEWGDAKGVPLVWAHGSGSRAYEIRALAPRLVQAGYRVLAVDVRGHGPTRVKDYDFGIYHVADDLVGLLDSLRIPAAVFGGASMGAFAAAAVYDQYPTRVLGLLMADGGTFSPQWIYDRQTPEEIRRKLPDPLPPITGASEFDVFQKIVGDMPAEGCRSGAIRVDVRHAHADLARGHRRVGLSRRNGPHDDVGRGPPARAHTSDHAAAAASGACTRSSRAWCSGICTSR